MFGMTNEGGEWLACSHSWKTLPSRCRPAGIPNLSFLPAPPLPCSKNAKGADAQVLRSSVLLDELLQLERPSSTGPVVVVQARFDAA